VRDALAALPGVRHVEVEFDTKQAVVTMSDGPTSQELIAALEEAGYGGSVANGPGVSAEPDNGDLPKETAGTPPPPGLPEDEQEPDATGKTYSSKSFADHLRISAYLDHDVLRPGDSFRIAVVFNIDKDWHIYGNPLGPGIGQETVVSLREEPGFDYEPARYAPAQRAEENFGEAGKTWVWELTGRTVQFIPGKIRDDLPLGGYSLTVKALAQVCKEKGACYPGKATLPLVVRVVEADTPSQPANSELFESFDQARAP